jgi:hypothetical protein
MIHAEFLAGNPLTGRKVWLLRHINGRKFGDPWDWSVVVIKTHRFSRTAQVKGALDLNNYRAHKSLQSFLAGMGFLQAEAVRRNGVVKRYNLSGDRDPVDGTGVAATSSATGT